MLWIGPSSSVFDITTYLLMFFVICPNVIGGSYGSLAPDQQASFMMLFQAGWFVESLWSQTLVIHMIRSPKIPFIQSRASWPVLGLTTIAIAIGTVIPFTELGTALGMMALPWTFFLMLLGIIVGYMLLTTLLKTIYVKRYGELL